MILTSGAYPEDQDVTETQKLLKILTLFGDIFRNVRERNLDLNFERNVWTVKTYRQCKLPWYQTQHNKCIFELLLVICKINSAELYIADMYRMQRRNQLNFQKWPTRKCVCRGWTNMGTNRANTNTVRKCSRFQKFCSPTEISHTEHESGRNNYRHAISQTRTNGKIQEHRCLFIPGAYIADRIQIDLGIFHRRLKFSKFLSSLRNPYLSQLGLQWIHFERFKPWFRFLTVASFFGNFLPSWRLYLLLDLS